MRIAVSLIGCCRSRRLEVYRWAVGSERWRNRTVAVDLDQIIHQALLTVRSLTEVQ